MVNPDDITERENITQYEHVREKKHVLGYMFWHTATAKPLFSLSTIPSGNFSLHALPISL